MSPRAKSIEVLPAWRGKPRRLPLGPAEIEEIRGSASGDAAAGRVASAQYGAIARWQLRLVGLDDGAVDRRIGPSLHQLYRGVFLLGPRAAHPLAHPTAGLLAAEGGILAFHTAAWLGGFGTAPNGVVHVLHPGRRASRKGLRFHAGEPCARVYIEGLPCTPPARTVVDMATVLAPSEATRVVDQALIAGVLTEAELRGAIVPNRRGAATLRAYVGTDRAKSIAEQHLFRLLTRAGLPTPEVNVLVAGCEFDFVWREQRLIIEYDSLKFHRTPERIENDARKQRIGQGAGFRVERVTRRDLFGEPQRLVVWVAEALVQTWPSTAPGTPVLVE
jgi:very-short-patch-repair endonuclease